LAVTKAKIKLETRRVSFHGEEARKDAIIAIGTSKEKMVPTYKLSQVGLE